MISSIHIWEILLALSASFFIGAIPFSYLVGRATKKVDPKKMKAGTVSGTALYENAGFVPLMVAGILDLAKAALVAIIFRYDGQLLRSLAVASAVAGHNWSPFLKSAGGRGLAPTLGGMGIVAWPATLWLGGALALGRLLRQTGLVVFVAYLCLPVVVFITAEAGVDQQSHNWFNLNHHKSITLGALCITLIVFIKRGLGNRSERNSETKGGKILLHRLLFDNPNPIHTNSR